MAPSASTLTWFRLASLLGLAWCLSARILGPSDAFDNTQPKTMAYTSDIVANGRWLLPVERGELPATKPPLYNWIAAPAVAVLGFSSDLAHKLPSVLAAIGCWGALVVLGRRLEPAGPARGVGWLAGLLFVANYSTFKLGYLARPDMLLTLWLVVGWMLATALILGPRAGAARGGGRRPAMVLAFWACVALAALTKGPAAALLPAYALLGGRLVGGSWRRAAVFAWWPGGPVALLLVGAWLFAVWRADPVHLVQELWFNEIYGRVTGLGSAGTGGRGSGEFLRRIAHMPGYFLVRFLPWSIPAVLAMMCLGGRTKTARETPEARCHGPSAAGPAGRARCTAAQRPWLRASVLFLVMVVLAFTLSAGKRGDYIAASLAPGAILAAWWLAGRGVAPGPRPGSGAVRLVGRFARWSVPGTAALVLAGLTAYNQLQPAAPVRDFAGRIDTFIREAAGHLASSRHPVAFWGAGSSHLQGHLGCSVRDGLEEVEALLRSREPFWLLTSRRPGAAKSRADRLDRLARSTCGLPGISVREVCRSSHLPRYSGWPGEVALLLVEPAEAATMTAAARSPRTPQFNLQGR